MPGRIEDLSSLGPVTARRLAEIGVTWVEDLRQLGALAAYQRLKFRFGRDVTLNALYGLECALTGMHWRDLPEARKRQLKAEVARQG